MGLLTKAAALAGALLGAGLAQAGEQDARPAELSSAPAAPANLPLSKAEAALVRQAVDRGTLIYAHDRAAWLGTDDLRAKLPDFLDKAGGWIVDGGADSLQLVFYDRNKADPRILYVADFKGTRLVSSRLLGEGDDRSLTSARRAMIAAKLAASEALAGAGAKICSRGTVNTVVLPPAAAGGATLVYFLTPQTAPKAIPMGGHHLVEVSAAGKAGKPRPFTNSCLEVSFEDEAGQPIAALVVSHLLDPVPTEIHVFSALAAGLPVFVSTGNGKRLRVWETNGRKIHLIADEPLPQPRRRQASMQRTR